MPLDPTYAFEPHGGVDGRAFVGDPTVTPAAWVELDITRWTLTVRSNNKDVSGTRTGRFRIGGLLDATGGLTMHWNAATDNRPSDTGATSPKVRHGSILDLRLYESPIPDPDDPTLPFRLRAIVDEVTPSSELEGIVDYAVTFSLQDGRTFRYPGDPA